jgi:hypothetical protein
MDSKATAHEVAVWMFEEVKRKGELYQADAVNEIDRKFGKHFTYENEDGNPAIDKKVLTAFRTLSKDSVVWEREDRYWRMRKPYDDPSRRQD